MTIRQHITVPFRGERDYLHGDDIFDAISGFLEESIAFVEIIRLEMKCHNFTTQQGEFVLSLRKGDTMRRAGPRAAIEFIATLKDGAVYDGWHEPGEKQEVLRIKGHESEIFEHSDFLDDHRIRLLPGSGAEPTEAVVFLTKRLHLEKLPHIKGKWLFAAIDTPRPFTDKDLGSLSVRLDNVLQDRFTSSTVRVGEKDVARIYFSLQP